jgi:hypothetical protein
MDNPCDSYTTRDCSECERFQEGTCQYVCKSLKRIGANISYMTSGNTMQLDPINWDEIYLYAKCNKDRNSDPNRFPMFCQNHSESTNADGMWRDMEPDVKKIFKLMWEKGRFGCIERPINSILQALFHPLSMYTVSVQVWITWFAYVVELIRKEKHDVTDYEFIIPFIQGLLVWLNAEEPSIRYYNWSTLTQRLAHVFNFEFPMVPSETPPEVLKAFRKAGDLPDILRLIPKPELESSTKWDLFIRQQGDEYLTQMFELVFLM